MLSFLGYNFLSDGNSLDPVPTQMATVSTVQLRNGIFDTYYLTSDTTAPFSNTFPTEWDLFTLMYANFNGDLNAGVEDIVNFIQNVTAIKIKRRVKGEFNWITLAEIQINTEEDFKFTFNDILNENLITYEYALVMMMEDVEGDYIINDIYSNFNGVFICDTSSIYKFMAGVKYGQGQRVQKIGTFEPFGSQYPIFISNGLLNYTTGSVTGDILPADFYTDGLINRSEGVKLKKELLDFLTNKNPKVIKDWNGNIWLVMIVDNPSISYKDNYGMGLASVSFNYSEIGDPTNQEDLYNTGFTTQLF